MDYEAENATISPVKTRSYSRTCERIQGPQGTGGAARQRRSARPLGGLKSLCTRLVVVIGGQSRRGRLWLRQRQ